MSGNESFAAPSAASSEGRGEEFWSDGSSPGPVRRRVGGHFGRPRPPPEEGDVGVWLVSVLPELGAGSSADGALPPEVRCRHQVAGLAVISWAYTPEEPLPVDPNAASGAVGRQAFHRGVWDILEYSVMDVVCFESPRDLVGDVDISSVLAPMQLQQQFSSEVLGELGVTLDQYLIDSPVGFRQILVREPAEFHRWVGIPTPFNLRIVELKSRVDRGVSPIQEPPASSLKRWKRIAGAQTVRASAARLVPSSAQVADPGRQAALD